MKHHRAEIFFGENNTHTHKISCLRKKTYLHLTSIKIKQILKFFQRRFFYENRNNVRTRMFAASIIISYWCISQRLIMPEAFLSAIKIFHILGFLCVYLTEQRNITAIVEISSFGFFLFSHLISKRNGSLYNFYLLLDNLSSNDSVRQLTLSPLIFHDVRYAFCFLFFFIIFSFLILFFSFNFNMNGIYTTISFKHYFFSFFNRRVYGESMEIMRENSFCVLFYDTCGN